MYLAARTRNMTRSRKGKIRSQWRVGSAQMKLHRSFLCVPASCVLLVGAIACRPASTGWSAAKSAATRATDRYRQLLEGTGAAQPTKIAGQAITYGGEVEGHTQGKTLDEKLAPYTKLVRFMGLHTAAWSACVADFPDFNGLKDWVLSDLVLQDLKFLDGIATLPQDLKPYVPESASETTYSWLRAVERGLGEKVADFDEIPASREVLDEEYADWLTHSSSEGWGYKMEGRIVGRPMAQLNPGTLRSLFLGEYRFQGATDIDKPGMGLAGLLSRDVCEAATVESNWVPHPGEAEKFLDEHSLSWEGDTYTKWELHLKKQFTLQDIEDFVEFWREGKVLDQSPQIWVVSPSSHLGSHGRKGLTGYLRLLQVTLGLTPLSGEEIEATAESMEHRVAAIFNDEIMTVRQDPLPPYTTPKGQIRFIENPWQGKPFPESEKIRVPRGELLDYDHIAMELRYHLWERNRRRWVLSALTARLAENYFDDMLVNDEALRLFPGLNRTGETNCREPTSVNADAIDRWSEEVFAYFAGNMEAPSLETIKAVVRWLFEKAPHPDSTIERFYGTYTQSIFLPLLRYHDLPCFHSEEERDKILRATKAWIETAESTALKNQLPAFWKSYQTWYEASGIHPLVELCLIPGHGGKHIASPNPAREP